MITLRTPSTSNSLRELLFVIQIPILLWASLGETQGQSRGQPSARDTARQIQRVERDQQLLLKPLPPTKEDDSVRRALLKQIKEDFRNIQGVNNEMMANAWANDRLDYSSISDSLSQIRSKAVRLRSKLSLPNADEEKDVKEKEKSPDWTASSEKDFRTALLRLDQSIMSFVTNPLFKESTVVEMSLATKASHDLDMVIELSEQLQKAGRLLNKKSSTRQ